MSETITNFLDLDAVESTIATATVKLGEKIHSVVPISVESWIANMKATRALQVGIADLDEEVNAMIGIVLRSFPTMELADLRKVTLANLNKLIEFARDHNGEQKAKKEAETEVAENPPVTSAPSTSDSSSAA